MNFLSLEKVFSIERKYFKFIEYRTVNGTD